MRVLAYIFILSIIGIFGCNIERTGVAEPTAEEIQKIQPVGKQITQEILMSLKSELQSAIAEGGFEKAIAVCNLKAMPLTKIVEDATGKNIRIKRTTNLFRNPLNAPDRFEKKALEHFEGLIAQNIPLPETYIQKVTSGDSTYFYFYKPLKMETMCLGCHGKPENIDQEILSQLVKLYPEDKATGYTEGDFRGLVSVRIPE
jgi:hypothetical protein